jgi:hypothetical protein
MLRRVMPKARTGKRVSAVLRKLAKRHGRKKLQRFYYDDPLAYVMPYIEYVRMCGTHVGYRAFVRVDEAQLFVQELVPSSIVACPHRIDAPLQND